MGEPMADRLGGGLEPAGRVGRIAFGPDALEHLLPEIRRVRRACSGHGRNAAGSIPMVRRRNSPFPIGPTPKPSAPSLMPYGNSCSIAPSALNVPTETFPFPSRSPDMSCLPAADTSIG